MRTFNNKYRGFIISIDEVSDEKAEYKILNLDKSVVEDTEGYCVTVDEAMTICKDTIDDIKENP